MTAAWHADPIALMRYRLSRTEIDATLSADPLLPGQDVIISRSETSNYSISASGTVIYRASYSASAENQQRAIMDFLIARGAGKETLIMDIHAPLTKGQRTALARITNHDTYQHDIDIRVYNSLIKAGRIGTAGDGRLFVIAPDDTNAQPAASAVALTIPDLNCGEDWLVRRLIERIGTSMPEVAELYALMQREDEIMRLLHARNG